MLKEYLGLIKVIPLVLVISGSGYLGHEYSDSKWEKKESDTIATQAKMISVLQEKYRLIEGKTQNEFTNIDNNDQYKILALQTTIDTNESIIGKLRAEITSYKQRLPKTTTYTGVDKELAAIATTATIYAELFGIVNEEARNLAIEATEARNRGLSCEAKYDAIYQRQFTF